MKIVLYSAGNMSVEFINDNKSAIKENEIVAIVDKDEKKQGELLCGYLIETPEIIREISYDVIIITSYDYYMEIFDELVNSFKVEKAKIGDFTFLQRLFAKKEANRHYKRFGNKHNYNILPRTDKIVVYTAIFGKYDYLKEPKYFGEDVDYICFTDNHEIESNIWKVIYCETNEVDDLRVKAKEYKCLPHKYLREYDVSVWIDGSVQVKENLNKLIIENMTTSKILFYSHPWRNCIYDEAEYTLKERKFEDVKKTKMQIKDYLFENMPHNNGLVCGGFIVRYHNNEKVKKVMEHWWEELQKYGLNDQVSLGYVLWKYKMEYDVMGEWIYDNEYITIKNHLVLDRG